MFDGINGPFGCAIRSTGTRQDRIFGSRLHSLVHRIVSAYFIRSAIVAPMPRNDDL